MSRAVAEASQAPRAQPLVTRTVRLPGDGLALAADRIGDPAAPAILFSHGGGWADLSDVVTDAGVARFRTLNPGLIVLDAKGVGHMFTGGQNDALAATLLDHLGRGTPLPE